MATLISQMKSITTGHNNSPKTILAGLEKCIDHMFQHNDWTPLAWLLGKIEPAPDRSKLRKITGVCVGGLHLITKGKVAEEQPSKLYLKRTPNCAMTEKMEILRQLVKDRESFRGQAVNEQLLSYEAKEFDLHEYIGRFIKKVESEGYDLSAALQEIAKVEKEAGQVDITKPEHHDKKIKAVTA